MSRFQATRALVWDAPRPFEPRSDEETTPGLHPLSKLPHHTVMFSLPASTVSTRKRVQFLSCQPQTTGQLHLVVVKETFARIIASCRKATTMHRNQYLSESAYGVDFEEIRGQHTTTPIGDVPPPTYDLTCSRYRTFTTDVQWKRVPSLETSGSETDTLPLGHYGPKLRASSEKDAISYKNNSIPFMKPSCDVPKGEFQTTMDVRGSGTAEREDRLAPPSLLERYMATANNPLRSAGDSIRE
ncbi:hypothetical protein AVEN_106027-1 [Araneus ventricosus]|uniref:Uncharacterized protein n=1 Tax=Araneus ventricosus TaxID=182803 RepID=A0A4Y2NK59_ARAVE|nr:hypothetical protein AVEN_106027-1 [Araneus ventricosus]